MTFPALSNLIGLFPNPSKPSRDYVPPLRPTMVQKLPVLKFVLGAQMVLRQNFRIRLEFFGINRSPGNTIEDLSEGSQDAVEFLRWRWRYGLSLSQAAEALGISRRQVAYYASGKHVVPRTALLACKGWEAEQKAAF